MARASNVKCLERLFFFFLITASIMYISDFFKYLSCVCSKFNKWGLCIDTLKVRAEILTLLLSYHMMLNSHVIYKKLVFKGKNMDHRKTVEPRVDHQTTGTRHWFHMDTKTLIFSWQVPHQLINALTISLFFRLDIIRFLIYKYNDYLAIPMDLLGADFIPKRVKPNGHYQLILSHLRARA